MKQKKKRALWVLMCLMTMVCANAQKIVTVDGLKYQLNGAYASVYQNTEGNTSAKINIPATISYEGLTYIVYAIDSVYFDSYLRILSEDLETNKRLTIITYNENSRQEILNNIRQM